MKLLKMLAGYGRKDDLPEFIGGDIVEAMREQAYSNHSQTLERLNERGGLAPLEAYFAHMGQRWHTPTFKERRAAYIWMWQNAVDPRAAAPASGKDGKQ